MALAGSAASLRSRSSGVVVLPDDLLAAGVADALDHRRVVQLIGQDHRVGQARAQRRQRRPVRDVAGGEQKRVFLLVEVGKLRLKLLVVPRVARDVARAPGPGAAFGDGAAHRLDHRRVLTHAEVVVGTPHRHLILTVRMVADPWESPTLALQFGEDAIVCPRPSVDRAGLETACQSSWGFLACLHCLGWR